MHSLSKGESPILAVRVPRDLHAAIAALAGPGRGARTRWLRMVLEREVARANDPGHSIGTHQEHHQEG